MKVSELEKYYESIFNVQSFSSCDRSLNGLQVGEKDADVSCAAFATDACIETIKAAAAAGASFLFVHHGLFWGPSALTGALYERVRLLVENKISLYACHLPLDCHPTLSHNSCMASLLGMKNPQGFASVGAGDAGLYGETERPLTSSEICSALGREKPRFVMGEEKEKYSRIGIISGDGNSEVKEAAAMGLDALITGEAHYSSYRDCSDSSLTVLCMGHYLTETFGVKAVKEKTERECGLKTVFIDVPSSL